MADMVVERMLFGLVGFGRESDELIVASVAIVVLIHTGSFDSLLRSGRNKLARMKCLSQFASSFIHWQAAASDVYSITVAADCPTRLKIELVSTSSCVD